MENCYNKCVIKLFDIPSELIENLVNDYVGDTLKVNINEKYRDVRVEITGDEDDGIVFANLIDKINKKYANYIYADEDVTLEDKLVATLKEKNMSISVAESLTGGLIASRIVSVSGASQVFYEGIVSYNPASKVRRLHVPLSVVETEGTVNEGVARAMTKGLLENKEIDFAFATTGCAGPLSDGFGTPIGKVFVSYGDRRYIEVKELNIEGDRETIRQCAVNYALFFILKYID